MYIYDNAYLYGMCLLDYLDTYLTHVLFTYVNKYYFLLSLIYLYPLNLFNYIYMYIHIWAIGNISIYNLWKKVDN